MLLCGFAAKRNNYAIMRGYCAIGKVARLQARDCGARWWYGGERVGASTASLMKPEEGCSRGECQGLRVAHFQPESGPPPVGFFTVTIRAIAVC